MIFLISFKRELSFSKFWQLDKIQHSLGICDVGSPLPKDPFSSLMAEGTHVFLWCSSSYQSACCLPRSLSITSTCYTFSESRLTPWLFSSLLASPSFRSFPPASYSFSPHNPAISAMCFLLSSFLASSYSCSTLFLLLLWPSPVCWSCSLYCFLSVSSGLL